MNQTPIDKTVMTKGFPEVREKLVGSLCGRDLGGGGTPLYKLYRYVQC